MSEKKYSTFRDFWPFYLREHSHPINRLLHYIGSFFALVIVFLTFYTSNYWLILLAPFAGYAFAWFGHFMIEKNRPATFTYPLMSFIGDWKMFALVLTGGMGKELKRLNIKDITPLH